MANNATLARGGSITSDLPENPPVYPGKPLGHRYQPTEAPRILEHRVGETNLAVPAPFKPMTSISYPDKNVYLSPVGNVMPRRLSSLGLTGQVSSSAQKEATSVLAEDFRKQLETQINNLLARYSTKLTSPSTPKTPLTTTVPMSAQVSRPGFTETVGIQLEKLKEVARQEIAKRGGQIKPPSTSTDQNTTLEGAVNSATDSTEKLLSEAAKIQQEIEEIQKETPRPMRVKEEPREKKEKELSGQINQLVTDRANYLKKINELTASLSLSQEKVKELDAFKSRLTEALGKEKDLLTQVTSLASEKTQLAKKINDLDLALKQELDKGKSTDIQISQTNAKIQGMETLVNDLRTRSRVATTPAIRVGQQSERPPNLSQPPTGIKVVKPQTAVGKMAPSLTNAPNVINGIIKGANGLLLSNVIIVVKDKNGEPVRALKTNKIGQFAISTPLPNGIYIMELESAGHSFDQIEVDIKGDVLPPIEIRAHN